MSGKKLAEEIATPLSDSDIKEFLPNALILKYSELSKYPTLHDILPDVKSYCFLLYENSLNKGHWTVISRPREGIAEYFDSYGGYVDHPLKWTDKQQRIGLGEGKPLLSILFNECEEEVVYNKFKYQKDGGGVNDCGRWCVLRTLKMIKGLDLDEFHRFVMSEAKHRGLSLDQLVTTLVE